MHDDQPGAESRFGATILTPFMADEKNDIYDFSQEEELKQDSTLPDPPPPADPAPPDTPPDTPDTPLESHQPAEDTPKKEDAYHSQPILLEGEAATECPSCGAPMPGSDEVVCIRCGFDLTRNKVMPVETGEVEDPEEEEEDQPLPPLNLPGKGGLPLPAIASGVCILIVTIFFLAGWHGVFPPSEDDPTFWTRLAAIVGYWAKTIIVAASVVGGLSFIGFIEKRKVGELNLALLRSLAIVAVCSLAILVGFPDSIAWKFLEFALQFILMAATFVVLASFFFEVKMRDAGILGGVALGFFLIIVLVVKLAGALIG